MDITNFIVSCRNGALLLGDYGVYRTQLSRRILTVRRKLGRTSPKGRKYTSKAPVTADDVASNREFVYLLLLTAERAWAQGMHMRATHSAETPGKPLGGPARRHIISRFRKASNYANELVQLLQEESVKTASAQQVLEAKAYTAAIAGSVEFEKRHWEQSLTHYAEARILYTALSTSTKNDVFKDLLNNTIDPSIQYAAYQLRLPRTLGWLTLARRYFPRADAKLVTEVDTLDPDVLSERTSAATGVLGKEHDNVPRTITWRSRTVDIGDSSIAQALFSVGAAKGHLSRLFSEPSNRHLSAKEKAAVYDDVLIPSQDAVDATKSAIDQLAGEGLGPGDKRMQALQVTRTAVNYALVEWRVGRNRVLCGEKDGALLGAGPVPKPRKSRKVGTEWIPRQEGRGRNLARLTEHVALYDATLQSLDSVIDLPGVAADEAFMAELKAKRAYFQALKCLSVARAHSLLSNRKAALALLTRALDISAQCDSAESLAASSETHDPPRSEVSREQARWLQQLLDGLVSQHRGLVELNEGNSVRSTSAGGNRTGHAAPLLERLDDYPGTGVDLTDLVTYPPRLEAIPVKPLFFDLAWNYIQYPGRAVQAPPNGEKATMDGDKGKAEGKKEAKRGWFGFGGS